ncbi:contactin 5 [Holotrichia oblita]|uniref:Contactin 5 n=1 Tax=Holotrichia oblita TaxID=644536 RepID=A0ACB9SIT9_HOLOL|nr:contactin 5 [Holotrichia oblita]
MTGIHNQILLEIKLPPSIQIIPPNGQITTRKGGPVSFECRANGNPPPTVQWSKKDGILPSGIQVQNGPLLSLVDVQRQHGGVYQCTASNGIGQPVTSDIKLNVLYPPEVTVIRSWTNTGEGLEAKLDCLVHSDPPAEMNASYHHPGQWHDLLVRPKQTYNSATSERRQSYIIKHLIPDSVYECLIQTKNQHGYGELSDLHQWFSSQKGRPLIHLNDSRKLTVGNCLLILTTILSFFRV